MERKETVHKAYCSGWEYICSYGIVEVWKTPTKYLSLIHYDRIYRYSNSESKARAIAIEMRSKY